MKWCFECLGPSFNATPTTLHPQTRQAVTEMLKIGGAALEASDKPRLEGYFKQLDALGQMKSMSRC